MPYRVDGGKTYFARREVADALLCLRAADDPSDGPALYGALHSSLFGFSDDDLFLFWDAGGRFDLFATEQPPGHEGIAEAMATLRRLHEARAACEPHELAAELLRVTHAVEFAAATGAGAPQAVANLEKLVERARAFAGAGGGGLAAFLDWAAEAGDAAGEQESQPDDEADVVRLLTVHKAKGLEYPIVVLIGGALAGGWGGRETVRPIVDRGRRRLTVKLKAELPGAVARDLTPRAYVELHEREKEMEASELRRLFYVAATRARDRLVVTSFGKLTKQGGEAASGVLLGCAAGALPAPARVEAAYEDGGVLVLPPGEPPARDERDEALDAATLVAARSAWLAERAALLATATRPAAATSPSGLEHVDEEVRAGGPGAPPGRARALALGSAVHRVMELCDLDDESSLPALAGGGDARAGSTGPRGERRRAGRRLLAGGAGARGGAQRRGPPRAAHRRARGRRCRQRRRRPALPRRRALGRRRLQDRPRRRRRRAARALHAAGRRLRRRRSRRRPASACARSPSSPPGQRRATRPPDHSSSSCPLTTACAARPVADVRQAALEGRRSRQTDCRTD